MPPTRSRALGLAMASSLLLTAGGLAAPVAAADSPEAAVNKLFEMATSRDLSTLDSLVCEAERESVRAMLDIEGQMGLDDLGPLLSALTFEISDISVDVTSNDGQTATAQVGGTMSMSVPDDQVEDLVRAMLEADQGPDDPPLSEEDLAFMVPLMGSALNSTAPIDEEVTLVVEDGQWLVCGGLGEVPEEPDYGFEPSVSSDGLCALATPDELSTLSALAYDSSNGFESFCSYSISDFEDYHVTSITLELDGDAETIAGYYGSDQPLEVGGAAAFAPGPEGFGNQLLTQVGPDILLVSVNLPEDPPEGLDWLTQAILVTELLMPRMADFRFELVGPTPPPTPEPTPEVSLCESLPMEVLNEQTGLGFDEATGDSAYCGYTSTDGEPGFHTVIVSLTEAALDDFLLWLPDLEETTVADQRALQGGGQLIVELPGGAYSLSVSGWLDAADESATATDDEMRRLVMELLLPNLAVPEPTVSAEEAFDLEALEAFLEDPSSGLPEAGPTLTRPMCEYIDLDAINALGILEYDTTTSFFDEMCSASQSDFTAGYSEISIFGDVFSIEDVRASYPDGIDITVAGLPGFDSGQDVRVWTSAGPITFAAILPDSAVEAGLVPADIAIPVAELVVAAIEADGE